jgi:hypothetical protein
MPLRMEGKRADNASHSIAPTMALDERHMEQVKSVLEHAVFHAQHLLTEVRISPASV